MPDLRRMWLREDVSRGRRACRQASQVPCGADSWCRSGGDHAEHAAAGRARPPAATTCGDLVDLAQLVAAGAERVCRRCFIQRPPDAPRAVWSGNTYRRGSAIAIFVVAARGLPARSQQQHQQGGAGASFQISAGGPKVSGVPNSVPPPLPETDASRQKLIRPPRRRTCRRLLSSKNLCGQAHNASWARRSAGAGHPLDAVAAGQTTSC